MRELNAMIGVLERRVKSKQRDHVEIEAEIEVMWPQAKGWQQPPEGEGTHSPLELLERVWPC